MARHRNIVGLSTATAALLVCAAAFAQTMPPPIAADARTKLKPGLYNAQFAISNLDLVISVPPPPGFEDTMVSPMAPAGKKAGDPRNNKHGGPAVYGSPVSPFTNTDLAFGDGRLVMGGFHGFQIYDLADPKKPALIGAVACPGGQGDVSLYGGLVFFSVEQNLGRVDCGGQAPTDRVSAARFRGVRIFDIANPKSIRQVAAVQTCRGSHTNTIVPDPKDPRVIYIYSSATAPVRSNEELAGCTDGEPDKNPETALYSIDVIKVPLDAPEKAAIVARPRIFTDPSTGKVNGLWNGGDHGAGTQKTASTDLCHDITAYPALGIAAGACGGNGILLDISDPVHPVRIDAVSDPNFAFWHSATFNNDGTKVVFTDEWGGGAFPRCRLTDPSNWGGDLVFSLQDRKLTPRAYYKLPAGQPETKNCVAHNGGLVPVPGRDILVQGWYGGGISMMDFTDTDHPSEIGYFDRGPISDKEYYLSGTWASYWYNGRIYAADTARGLDVLALKPSAFLTKNEIAAAELVKETGAINIQSQGRIVWPNDPVVGLAYLDQLLRDAAISKARGRAIRSALERISRRHNRPDQFADLANTLDQLAQAASGRDVERFQGIVRILRSPEI